MHDEFAGDELAAVLSESRAVAETLLGLAGELAARLPGTAAALRDGVVSRRKAEIIVHATALLDPDEAHAAEAEVLDRAGQLTPGGLRAAIARAVIKVAPDKARKRREHAAKEARVERWAEDTGNAALMGRELPPDEVLAADQRICSWAGELRQAGLEGGLDELRARAFLDLLLGKDSRPRPAADGGDSAAIGHGCARPEPRGHRRRAGPGPPLGGCGFSFTPVSRDGPPGGFGTWRLRTPGGGPDLIVTLDPITTDPCDHRFEARGHDAGVKLKHLAQIRHATCTSPVCRRPAAQCDLEHNTSYEAGGRTCLCNTGRCSLADAHWPMLNMPSGTPAIWIWRQIERCCGSSW